MRRSRFLKYAGTGSLAGLGALSCYRPGRRDPEVKNSSKSNFDQEYQWKMVTTWPPRFPIIGEMCEEFADWVETMTGGRMQIKVFGSGELVPAFQVFEAVSSGVAEIGHGAAYYWSGKIPAAQLFSTIPFGLSAEGMRVWINAAGGLDLYHEVYESYNLLPFLGGNTGAQMGGWYNKSIDDVASLKGLKIRMPGLGGEILREMGATPILSPGGEIYTNLERGVIDATEWIGPFHDYSMGFHEIAKYYYAPGWHEPGTTLEIVFNKSLFEQLPRDIQEILRTGTEKLNNRIHDLSALQNGVYLEKLKAQNITIKRFPNDVIQALRKTTRKVLERESSKDELFSRILASMREFQKTFDSYAQLNDLPSVFDVSE